MEKPPYYIFVSNSSFLSAQSSSPSLLLSHPTIQYHYLDDSPLALLPQSADEHVLVLDYDPGNVTTPAVKSTSSNVAVTGVKVTSAPGAGVVDAEETNKNDNMYVIQMSTLPESRPSIVEDTPPQAVIARFKQRNTILRRSLEGAVDFPQLHSPDPSHIHQIVSPMSSTPTPKSAFSP